MKVLRGEVVLVDYLFSNRSRSKVRPCLVVQGDDRNRLLTNTIVVAISSNTSRTITDPTQLLVSIATVDGAQSGLLIDSALQCGNLLTLDTQFVIRKIGSLPGSLMQQIDQCLKLSLGLR
jgi:mRNA interferase MazF